MQDQSSLPKQDELPNDKVKPSSPKLTLQTFWLSIVVSIIASAVVALFIQPIFSFVSRVAVGFLSVFYEGFIDSLYEQAAVNAINVPIFAILTFVTLLPLGGATGLAMRRFLRGFAKNRASKKKLNSIWLDRFSGHIAIIGIVMIIVFIFTFDASAYVPMQADATFQQRLSALGPVLSDADRKSLVSQWALMKSRADYDKINGEFEDTARRNHVELPPPLI